MATNHLIHSIKPEQIRIRRAISILGRELEKMRPTEKCSCNTRKGHPCPIKADRIVNGVEYCHVHDPTGVFRQQQDAKAMSKGLLYPIAPLDRKPRPPRPSNPNVVRNADGNGWRSGPVMVPDAPGGSECPFE